MPYSRLTQWIVPTAALAGLWAVAVAQPILDLLSRSPECFIAHHLDRFDMLVLTALAVWGPPLAAGSLIAVAALVGRRTSKGVAALLTGVLLAVFVLQVSYRFGVSSWLAAASVALVTTTLGAVAWLKTRGFRVALTVMSVAALIVPALFLLSGGIRAVMRGGSTVVAARTSSQLAPVVLIVFDELPLVTLLDSEGRIDATRYPNFAALAGDGVWFRNATTVSDYTRWALPALLSGRFPNGLSVPTPGDHPNTLFTLLASTHRMKVVEPLTALCPAQLSGKAPDPFWFRARRVFDDVRIVGEHVLLPPDARAGLPSISEGWAGFDAKVDEFKRVWKQGGSVDHRGTALEFVDGIARTDLQPTLYFMHTMVSHHPPRWLPSGQTIEGFTPPAGGVLKSLVWTDVEWPVVQYQQGHLAQAGFADLLIGRLRTRLREAGVYDRTLIVVTADHGMSFRPGDGMRGFTKTNAGEILPVPLIVKLSSDRQLLPAGTVDDSNVEIIDIPPTIADGLGITMPWTADGTSALRHRDERPEKRIYFNKNVGLDRFTPADVARLRGVANARKTALFGTGLWPSPSPPGLEPLIGRAVESLPVGNPPAGFRLQIDDMYALDDVRLGGRSLPAQVKGHVLAADGRNVAAVYLAIALNGEIVATTRTWSETADWRVLLPPDRLRNGRNDLEVFVVDPARPLQLMRTTMRRVLPPGTDLLFGDVAESGVTHEGFHHVEQADATPFHWTDGAASIRVPIDPAHKPTTLSISVLFTAKAGMRLQVLVDDCEVASEKLPGGPSWKSFTLGACQPSGRWATIRLVSETVQPGGRDMRRLGVALSRVALR
jgi:hypothetical protein